MRRSQTWRFHQHVVDIKRKWEARNGIFPFHGHAVVEVTLGEDKVDGEVQKRSQIDSGGEFCTTTIAQAPLLNHGVSRPRSGRPKCYTIRDQQYIIRAARVKPDITYRELIEVTGVNFSKATVYRILKEYGLTNWLAKKRPLLREEDTANRLAWAKERKDWTDNDWRKLNWTDEFSVERGTGKENIQAIPKGRDVSVMVWGAFWGDGRSDLNKMERDPLAKNDGYSAKSYVKILEDNLPGIWTPGLIFMHDNAPIHNAGPAKIWLEEHGISLMKWPPYSPDLNPIEHLWFHLKKMVYEVRPDIEQVCGDDEKVREALFEASEEAWPRLSEELLATLIGSMKSRVNSVIEAEGCYTRY